MAIYTIDKISKDVRVALDQNMISDALVDVGDIDTLAIDDIIKSKITEAVKRIHSNAPSHLLDGGYNFGDWVYWDTLNSGWVLLPEDFMRFVVFEMDDWERPVFYAIGIDDTDYNKQSSRFKGIRGTSQKPVCAISIRPEGRVLEFYSCKSNEAKVSRAVYLPYPKIDCEGGIEICKRCYDAVVYMIASLTLITLGETEKANGLLELSKSALI